MPIGIKLKVGKGRTSLLTKVGERKVKGRRGAVRSAMRNVLRYTAIEMVSDIKQSMTDTPRSNKAYPPFWPHPSYNRSATHFSSRPGSPPAVDFGKLIDSITFDVSSSPDLDTVEVGSTLGADGMDAPYGLYLEEGVPVVKGIFPGTTIEPRPWLGPAWERAQSRLGADLEREVGRALAAGVFNIKV